MSRAPGFPSRFTLHATRRGCVRWLFKPSLVVDDESHIVEIVRDYLRQAGYRVVTAGDGQTALTLGRHERPDLIVLDLMLPGGLDGLDVCWGV